MVRTCPFHVDYCMHEVVAYSLIATTPSFMEDMRSLHTRAEILYILHSADVGTVTEYIRSVVSTTADSDTSRMRGRNVGTWHVHGNRRKQEHM